MYRVKVATNSSRIWLNHFRKLMQVFSIHAKINQIRCKLLNRAWYLDTCIEDESWNYLISLNWLNLCYYRCENATHVVNNYDWFLSIYKRSLSTKLWEELIPFFIISTSIRKTLLQRWHIHMTSEKTLLGFRFISIKHFCNKVDGLTLSVQNG